MRFHHVLACLALFLPLAACATHEVLAVESSTPVVQDEKAGDLSAADAHFAAGRWSEAITAYEVALEADPNQGAGWFRLGYSLHAAGELERACEVHEKATAYKQFAPVAAYNLGCAHALLGRPDKAFAALDRSVKLGFNDVGQLDGDSDLVSLHDDPRWTKLRARLVPGGAKSKATDAAELRQMDFWVGDWDVTTAGGQKLGTNKITNQLGGHLVFEEWTGAGGGTGKSMNYWDRDAGQWKQVWVSQGGNVLQMAGTFTDGSMRFRGVTMYKGGKSVDHKTTLTPLDDGRVRQFIEESKDGGTTWKATFEGFYAPRGK